MSQLAGNVTFRSITIHSLVVVGRNAVIVTLSPLAPTTDSCRREAVVLLTVGDVTALKRLLAIAT